MGDFKSIFLRMLLLSSHGVANKQEAALLMKCFDELEERTDSECDPSTSDHLRDAIKAKVDDRISQLDVDG